MQQGGSPYGTPPPPLDMSLFSTSTPTLPPSAAAATVQQPQMTATVAAAEPISSRPPQQLPSPSDAGPNYEELGPADDPLGEEGAAGGGVSGGNRWPRQETLALLKIRSDMDAAFRDATLKSPLWEEVSRKLAELGYTRSAKKCKEKFENVHKYYKRTKEGRAGRQDGKSYRFFSQLEALHSTPRGTSVFPPSPSSSSIMPTAVGSSGQTATPIASAPNPLPRFQTPQQQQISAPMPIATAPPPPTMTQMFGQEHHPNMAGISFSSNTSSDAGSEDDDEVEDDDEATEERPGGGGKKRKRQGSGGGAGGRKMMAFFEGLMRQVMERQEAMQQRFLEAIEKREHERMIREEAWRRQEMARLGREHEITVAERAATAARDAAVMSFLQKVTGQTVPIPPPASAPPPPSSISIAPSPMPPQPQPIQHQQQKTQLSPPPPPPSQPQQPPAILSPPPRPTSSELIPFSSEPQEGVGPTGMSMDPTSSRWPKSEVHALIKLRSGLDSRYQETGPKGPLWEEISSGMKQLGYNRNPKRCKEKWENINKYFKKVKESNKKRPEDAKTCPYFHQLDALYRTKQLLGGGNTSVPALTQRPHEHEIHPNPNPNPNPNPISIMPPQQQQQQPVHQGEMDTKRDSGGSSNGGMPSTFFGGNGDDSTNTNDMLKKPEDIVKELMGQSNTDDYGSDNMDDDEDDDDDDDEDDGKTQYRIQFQRQNVSSGNGNGSSAAPSGGGKTGAGSFLAMVR